MTNPTPAEIKHQFSQRFAAVARELDAISKLWDEHGLPMDFMGDTYPFANELDEVIADVYAASDAMDSSDTECGDWPAPCNHDDEAHTVRMGAHGQPV